MNPDRWDDRLHNWALWYYGDRSGYTEPAAYDRIERQDATDPKATAAVWETAAPQAVAGHAMDTHELVMKLSDEHFRAILAWYCWQGPLDVRLADLNRAAAQAEPPKGPIHVNTLRNRVKAAKVELERLDGERSRMRTRITKAAVRVE